MEVNVTSGSTILSAEGKVVNYFNNQFNKYRTASITKETTDNVVDYCNKLPLKWVQGTTGADDELNREKRNSQIAWIEDSKLKDYIFTQFESANTDPDWGFDLDAIEDLQYSIYERSETDQFHGHYDWHNDVLISLDQPRRCRKLSMTMMLSQVGEDYEGGNFQFATIHSGNAQHHSLELNYGDILVFPSFMEHRVNFVTKGVRRVLVAWAWGPLFM